MHIAELKKGPLSLNNDNVYVEKASVCRACLKLTVVLEKKNSALSRRLKQVNRAGMAFCPVTERGAEALFHKMHFLIHTMQKLEREWPEHTAPKRKLHSQL